MEAASSIYSRAAAEGARAAAAGIAVAGAGINALTATTAPSKTMTETI